MHAVIKHLLARRNKQIPVEDGRKITLVLPGGLMTGVRGAGAIIGLSELGLADSFDAIYVISAGLASASYFLSKQTRLGTSIYYEDLASRKFINVLRPWNVVNIDYFIDVARRVKPLNIRSILAHPTKLYVRIDRKDRGIEYIEVHKVPDNEYLSLMEATVSLPFLHPGTTKIGENHYKDPEFFDDQLSVLIQDVLDSDATEIIIIYNNLEQQRGVRKALVLPPQRVLEIAPRTEWHLSRFETNTKKLKEAALQMGQLIKQVFGSNEGITLDIDNDHQNRS